jgi:hypothetical protein
MRFRLTGTLLAALTAALLACSIAAAAGLVGIYRNGLDSKAQRRAVVKLSGRNCERGGTAGTLSIGLGKRTDACSMRTPVVGRDLELAATERLLSGTPRALQRKAYLGLELRAGGGAKYQLLVFPLQQKVQLVRVTSEGNEFLDIAKQERGVLGIDKANKLRLRTINRASGPEKGSAQIAGYVGGKRVVEAVDGGAADLPGRSSAIVIGATKGGNGVVGSIDDIVVRVPSPY